MNTYYIRTEIGGSLVLKVQAPDEDTAITVAQSYTIDDWENAGHLHYSDVDAEIGEVQGSTIAFRGMGDIHPVGMVDNELVALTGHIENYEVVGEDDTDEEEESLEDQVNARLEALGDEIANFRH